MIFLYNYIMNSEFTKEFFDDSSNEWRRNKVKLKGGAFEYCCGMYRSDGKVCKRNKKHRKFHKDSDSF